MRFDLYDNHLVNKEELNKLKNVMSVVEVAGQTQVVIGPEVIYYYPELETFIKSKWKR
ncbi:hypothetical protein [Streptococcus sanguinis]|uniref:hypothetical protein n=1 Tax=Streptococcus sanguinis TaxID=1305 RepID=UPI00210D9446